jgi:hypothetical protein
MFLDTFGGYRLSVETIDGTVEEIFEFKDALRRVDIFVSGDSADG